MPRDERPRVIVGVARSTTGLRALRLGVTEARQRGAVLHAVRAYQPLPSTAWLPAEAMDTSERDAQDDVLKAFTDTMGGPPTDLDVVVVVAPGQPGRVLVDYARRDEDLLMVGVSRRPWWGRALRLWRGCVARYCVGHATCPLQVVPPDQFARDAMRTGLGRRLSRELSTLTGS